MHRRTYAAYWDVLTPAELTVRARELTAETERMRALEAATISSVAIGDREIEKKFNQQGVETSVIRTDGRSGRRAIQWFSYDLPVNGQTMVTLVATYNSDQRRPRSFDVIVDGQKLASESQPQSSLSKFYEKEYVIPADVMRHKEKLTVRFEATNGLEVTPVFGRYGVDQSLNACYCAAPQVADIIFKDVARKSGAVSDASAAGCTIWPVNST